MAKQWWRELKKNMVSKTNYIINDLTEQEICEALDYISITLKNPNASKRLYEDIYEKIGQLVMFPNSGEIYNNEFVANQNIRRIAIDNYYLYYVYEKEKKLITFVSFIHMTRNISVIIQEIS